MLLRPYHGQSFQKRDEVEQHATDTSQPATTPVSGKAWFGDPLFTVGFLLWVLTMIVALVPILPADVRSTFSDLWADFVTLPFTVGLAAWNFRRSESSAERRFWGLLATGFAMWIIVRILYVSWPDDLLVMELDIATDVLYGAFYLMIALALEMRPHREPRLRTSVRSNEDGVSILTTVTFFAATVAYFVIVPAQGSPETHSWWAFSFGLYVVLDLYLVGRMLAISHRVRGPWSNVYRWLTITFVMWAITDAAEAGLYAEVLPWVEPGDAPEVIWYIPTMIAVVAIRSRWWPARKQAER